MKRAMVTRVTKTEFELDDEAYSLPTINHYTIPPAFPTLPLQITPINTPSVRTIDH